MQVLTEVELKAIIEAADNEDVKKALEALMPFQNKINGQELKSSGDTPLIRAVMEKRHNALKSLIAAKADVNVRVGKLGKAPLHQAAVQGFVQGIDLLFNARADIVQRDNFDFTPLHYAIGPVYLDATHTLLELNADVNAKRKHCGTPLNRLIVLCSSAFMRTSLYSSLALILLEKGAHRDPKENDDIIYYNNDVYKLYRIYPKVKSCFEPQYLQFPAAVFKVKFLMNSQDLSNRTALFDFISKYFWIVNSTLMTHHDTAIHDAAEILEVSPGQVGDLLGEIIPGYMIASYLSPRVSLAFLQSSLTSLKAVLKIVTESLPMLPFPLQALSAAYAGLPSAEPIPTSFSKAEQTKMMKKILGNDWDQKTSLEEMLADKHNILLQTYLNSLPQLKTAEREASGGFDGDHRRTIPHMLNALELVLKDQPSLKQMAVMEVGSGSANIAASNKAAASNKGDAVDIKDIKETAETAKNGVEKSTVTRTTTTLGTSN